MVLQNTGGSVAASSEVTFGQVFKAGAVAPGAQLYATVTGADGSTSEVAVQMDAKTFNADGSVATSVLSFLAPSIAAGTSSDVMLSVGPALANAAPLDLAAALKNYSLTVDLSVQGGAVQSGTASAPATTNYHIDAVAAMQAALADGTASFWQSGPNVAQARVIVPVAGSMQMVFDITANANGTFSTDVQFDNDEAWVQNASGQIVTGTAATDQGGTVTYNETITQNGAVVSQQSNVTQYQYQNWHKVVTTQPSIGQINIQHDVAYLEATGAVQNYDLTTGIPAADIAGYVSTMASAPNSATTSNLGSGYGQPLAANGVDPGMSGTGSRPDIGPTTNVNSDWLMTQNATVAQYALGEADAAGAVPWNMQNGVSGLPLTTLADVNLWTDSRGGPYSGSSGLLQNPNNGNTWSVDTSHQPDLSYDPYLLTGSRYNFDELQQQAAYSITSQWPAWQQRSRNAASDLIVNGNQVRGAAWELRQVDEAAYTALPGSAMKAYFTQVENDNFAWLVSQEATWTAQQGQAYGWLPGVYGNNGNYGPWEQDFLSIVVAQAAEQGNALAKQFMAWEDNFIVGRFLQAQNGFLPQDGIAYTLQFYDPKTGLNYQTWAQIEQVTASYGLSNGPDPNATGWVHSQGYYGQTALAALAGAITVFQSTQAIQAYGWLLASGAPYINGPVSGQYSIVPRLSDGNLLTHDNLLISPDAAGTTNTLTLNSNNDQLIHAGSGTDTLKGGTGINILFAGSGTDMLIGGPNNDYLYGGTGSDTFSAGAGANYMQAGSGPDTFIINQADTATDTIANFKIGTDQLNIQDATGNTLNAASIQTLVTTATADPQGNAILHLSVNHAIILQGITLAELANDGPYNNHLVPLVLSVMEQTDPSGVTTLQNSGENISGGTALLTIIDDKGASTINGGGGGLNLVAAGTGDIISTNLNASDVLTISNQDTVTANGNDAVTVTGIGNAISLSGGSASIDFLAGSASNAVTANGMKQFIDLAGNTNNLSVTSGNSAVSISGSGNTVQSSSSSLNVSGNNNNIELAGPQSIASMESQSAGGQVVFLGGSGNTLHNSNTNIIAVNGDNSVTAAGSALIVVEASSMTGSASLTGTAALFADGAVVSAQGDNLILLSGGSNSASIGAATTIFDNGGMNTITAAQGGIVYGGAGSLAFTGGSGISFIHPGQGSVTAFGGSGGLIAYGGSNGDNLLQGGTGSASLFGGGNGDTLIAGAGPAAALFAGPGNETLNASQATGAVTLTGGYGAGGNSFAQPGVTIMLGGGGTNVFFAGGGTETMTGGANALSNIFVFGSGSGNATDFVSGYHAASDKIELVDGVHLRAPMSSISGITKISLSDGTQITVSAMLSKAQVLAQGVVSLS